MRYGLGFRTIRVVLGPWFLAFITGSPTTCPVFSPPDPLQSIRAIQDLGPIKARTGVNSIQGGTQKGGFGRGVEGELMMLGLGGRGISSEVLRWPV